jgi:hypothetical protein
LNSFERILISEIIEELLIEFNLFFILCSCNYDLLTDFL